MCGGGGCGSAGILPGSITARKNKETRESLGIQRVPGYSSNGIIKSEKRKLREAGKVTLEYLEESQRKLQELAEDEFE